MNDQHPTDHLGGDTPTDPPRDGLAKFLEFIRTAIPLAAGTDSDVDENGLTLADYVDLDVDRDGLTGKLQVAIVHWPKGEGYGDGHRLHGPKYSGHSTPVLSRRLTREDADEIRTRLDQVFPIADVDAAHVDAGEGETRDHG